MEEFIMNLSPELQEKARKCESLEELLALAKEEKVELPPAALEAIAGGNSIDTQRCGKPKCPQCGSKKSHVISVSNREMGWIYRYKCGACGYEWEKFYYYEH